MNLERPRRDKKEEEKKLGEGVRGQPLPQAVFIIHFSNSVVGKTDKERDVIYPTVQAQLVRHANKCKRCVYGVGEIHALLLAARGHYGRLPPST